MFTEAIIFWVRCVSCLAEIHSAYIWISDIEELDFLPMTAIVQLYEG